MESQYAAETVVVRRAGEMRKRVALVTSALLAVAACAAIVASYASEKAAEPSIESMYHMWLGPNGLPLSPRKQRGLLFQFCTTVQVYSAEFPCIRQYRCFFGNRTNEQPCAVVTE